MYSALKHNGKSLYKIARTGRSVERKTRIVEISRIEIKDFDDGILTVEVSCSSGTYIRTLASDIGKALGTGAVLAGLKRKRIGEFFLESSIKLKEISGIEKINNPIKDTGTMISMVGLLSNNPTIFIKDGHEKAIKNGKRISPGMIDLEKTDINGIKKLSEKGGHDFKNMVPVKDLSGNILAIHGMVENIKFEDMGSFEFEFTKSIVIF